MKRRKFLQSVVGAGLPYLIKGIPLTAVSSSALFNFIDEDNDHVLVLINMIGGNDGLNTLVPLDQYDHLNAARSNIIIPENKLLNIDSANNAFHPSLLPFMNLWDDAKMAIVQNVGYPNQNRSHFRSSDIWSSGSAADEYMTTGWLGRYLDYEFPGYPEDFPNENNPDPFAITLGFVVSETCQGISSNFSTALNDLDNLSTLQEPENSELPDSCYGNELFYLRNAFRQTNAYSESIALAAENGSNLSDKYPEDNQLAKQLRVISKLISGGLKTKVYIASIGGFDTHANQVEDANPENGTHANLLLELSEAIYAFQDDLKLLGLEDRVMGMTFSEFGRRIKSNFSFGTDHGTAAPMFLFGKCVNPGVIGENPIISDNVGNQDGISMQYDFRSVYGSVLMDWFDATEEDVRNLLYEDFNHLPIISGCSTTANPFVPEDDEVETAVYPNPFQRYFELIVNVPKSRVKISIFDTLGSERMVIVNKDVRAGDHQFKIDTGGLAVGQYFVRIKSNYHIATHVIQKIY